MTLYQIVLTPASPAASPLQSDTLFGAVCWSWLRRHGRDALEADLIVPSPGPRPNRPPSENDCMARST